jgi:hypothetical protein
MIQRSVYIVFHKGAPVRVRDSEPGAIRYIRRNAIEPTQALIKQNRRVHGVVMDDPKIKSSTQTADMALGIPQVE